MTRSSSSDSSALSNILVAATQEGLRDASPDDSDEEDQAPMSTPPTSWQDSVSNGSAKAGERQQGEDVEEEDESARGRRPKRARAGMSTYNLKKLSDAQQFEESEASRNVSGLTGRTLVDEEDEEEPLAGQPGKGVEMDWEVSAAESPKGKAPVKVQRRTSIKDRVKKVAGKVGAALGKRKRDVVEAGRRTFGKRKVEQEDEEDVEEEDSKKSKWLKELDMGTKGVLDEMDLDEEYEAPPQRPVKKARTSGKDIVQESSKPLVPTKPTAAPIKSVSGKGMKKWQREGLYVGQQAGFDPLQVGGGKKKLQKKSRPDSAGSDFTKSEAAPAPAPVPAMAQGMKPDSFITLPMFAYLDKTRDFTIPFDIYAPSAKKGDEKPKDWHKVNRNRLVGEAKDLWAKVEKLPPSACICPEPAKGQMSCEDDCLNRVMQYECNEDNCALPAEQCSNRAFAELAARTKKGGAFDIGVEVLKTDKRGFGVRSCRSFAPGQIIMEYTGEIVSEGECQRRMREDYNGKQCYYLMELERGLIIDGTKGSMARFINHSCAPNCEVRMVKVNGTPRMAVFAGDEGVMTGEELTYDYNFDNFGTTQQQCFCGAPSCRGFLSKRLNAAEMKKQAREEEAKKRKAAEEAMRAAEREVKRRKVVEGRGSGWRGWVAVDDPETKERLKEEKKAREEAEKNSSRARRMAARRGSLPGEGAEKKREVKKEPKRRRTVQIHQDSPPALPETAEAEDEIDSAAPDATFEEDKTTTVTQTQTEEPQRSTSTTSRSGSVTSKFHEEFTPKQDRAQDRPISTQTMATMNTTITHKTEVSISTTTSVLQSNAHALEDAVGGAELAAEGEEVVVSPGRGKDGGKEKEGGLKRTASKGKEVLKKAFKGSFSSSPSTGGSGSGKMKQTTLSFGKMA